MAMESRGISPSAELAPPQLTLTSSAPQSCHHHFPSAISPPGPGGAGRTSWSPGCLDRLTSAGTGNAGPSSAPPATGKAKLISWNPWAALISFHWRFDREQERFAMHGQYRQRGETLSCCFNMDGSALASSSHLFHQPMPPRRTPLP